MNKTYPVKRGDIYLINLSPVVGSEQDGVKYCVVVQNDVGNRYSPTTIICPLTRVSHGKNVIPTHMDIEPDEYNRLDEESIIMFEQIRTVDKRRILEYKGRLSPENFEEMNKRIKISVIGVEDNG